MSNQSYKNRMETLLDSKINKQSEIEACGNHLKEKPKSERPNQATLDSVRNAIVQSQESLIECEESVSATNRVNCPCLKLGASVCMRDPPPLIE